MLWSRNLLRKKLKIATKHKNSSLADPIGLGERLKIRRPPEDLFFLDDISLQIYNELNYMFKFKFEVNYLLIVITSCNINERDFKRENLKKWVNNPRNWLFSPQFLVGKSIGCLPFKALNFYFRYIFFNNISPLTVFPLIVFLAFLSLSCCCQTVSAIHFR